MSNMYLQLIKHKTGGKQREIRKTTWIVLRIMLERTECCYKTPRNDLKTQTKNTPFSPLCNEIIYKWIVWWHRCSDFFSASCLLFASNILNSGIVAVTVHFQSSLELVTLFFFSRHFSSPNYFHCPFGLCKYVYIFPQSEFIVVLCQT